MQESQRKLLNPNLLNQFRTVEEAKNIKLLVRSKNPSKTSTRDLAGVLSKTTDKLDNILYSEISRVIERFIPNRELILCIKQGETDSLVSVFSLICNQNNSNSSDTTGIIVPGTVNIDSIKDLKHGLKPSILELRNPLSSTDFICTGTGSVTIVDYNKDLDYSKKLVNFRKFNLRIDDEDYNAIYYVKSNKAYLEIPIDKVTYLRKFISNISTDVYYPTLSSDKVYTELFIDKILDSNKVEVSGIDYKIISNNLVSLIDQKVDFSITDLKPISYTNLISSKPRTVIQTFVVKTIPEEPSKKFTTFMPVFYGNDMFHKICYSVARLDLGQFINKNKELLSSIDEYHDESFSSLGCLPNCLKPIVVSNFKNIENRKNYDYLKTFIDPNFFTSLENDKEQLDFSLFNLLIDYLISIGLTLDTQTLTVACNQVMGILHNCSVNRPTKTRTYNKKSKLKNFSNLVVLDRPRSKTNPNDFLGSYFVNSRTTSAQENLYIGSKISLDKIDKQIKFNNIFDPSHPDGTVYFKLFRINFDE